MRLRRKAPVILAARHVAVTRVSPARVFDALHDPLLWLATEYNNGEQLVATATQAAASTTVTATIAPETLQRQWVSVVRLHLMGAPMRNGVVEALCTLTWSPATFNEESVYSRTQSGEDVAEVATPVTETMTFNFNLASAKDGVVYVHLCRRTSDFPVTVPDRALILVRPDPDTAAAVADATVTAAITGLASDPTETGLTVELSLLTLSSPNADEYITLLEQQQMYCD